jgi:hypothetical protein
MKLYQKIAAVMAEVEKIPKHGRNDHFGYDFVQEVDLTEHLRKLLVKHGLVILPSLDSIERDGNLTTARMTYVIVDTETGEKEIFSWAGESTDKGDKGLYKAYTGAGKYFLMKAFMVVSGDDPEEGNIEKKPAKQPAKKPPASITQTAIYRKMWATAKDIFKATHSDEDIKRMLHEHIQDAFGLESSKDMTKEQIDLTLEWLEGWKE